MELKRVVVTGIGSINALGKTIPEFEKNLFAGVSGSNMITNFDASKFKTKFACEVKEYNPLDYFDRKEVRKLDRITQFAMIASSEAIMDSKLNLDTIDKDQVGVIGASGIGGLETMDKEMIDFAKGDGTPRFNPFFIPKMIVDISAGHISMKYGFHGPNYATISACASSSHAIIDSFMQIILGKAKVMIACGSEAPITISGVGGFNAMHAISTKNDEYQTASRPFSKNRDGFVMAEGGAGLVLEEYEHAIKRGARIYAELVGTGASADAHHLTAPHPEGLGAIKVMKAAIAEAGIQPEDIDYINTHGTSTPLGDISETKAIVSVFKEHAYK
ncbi:MAG: beta-ketoacyl-ACP synthase II, partial [Bacteroidales bacterium]|nr:beta-ketoacyl-ACP synthase II [Bacteroidales bacterium]